MYIYVYLHPEVLKYERIIMLCVRENVMNGIRNIF